VPRLCVVALLGAFVIYAANRPHLHPLPKQAQKANTGPEVGSRIPPFDVNDQNGRLQTFDSLCDPKGLVLQFDRSAGWCPSCKGALLELKLQAATFRSHGFGVAALTHDTVAVLRSFANRKSIVCIPGGFKGGTIYGATDEIGYAAAENPVSHSDLHATILSLPGMDVRELTYDYDSRVETPVGVTLARLLKEISA
jgi:hypothetical protein